MKKIVIFVSILLLLGGHACKPKVQNKQNQAIATSDNSENSLDWAGVYSGVVPCANCEGISVEITLNKDLTYKIVEQYLGKEIAPVYSSSGTFTWSADGSTVTLAGIENGPTHYKVGENILIQLDMEGKPIVGKLAENYVLKKIPDSETEITSMADNSKTSLNWIGVYSGIVPCADCEGIKTTITLYMDDSYNVEVEYLGKKNVLKDTYMGEFKWNADGSTITLSGIKNGPTHYKVGENVLIQLDLEGKPITGALAKNYELKKMSDDQIATGDNSNNSLDWDGMYTGVVPCGNCEGIRTQITLKKDNTYKVFTQYLGSNDVSMNRYTGTIKWSADGSTIKLEGIESGPSQYKVGENILIQLDMEGKPITGEFAEKYVLKKK